MKKSGNSLNGNSNYDTHSRYPKTIENSSSELSCITAVCLDMTALAEKNISCKHLARSFKVMHFSAGHIASFFQGLPDF